MTLPLFDHSAPVTELRDAAMVQVETHAEAHRPGFKEQACAFVLDYLEQHGASSGEVITDACKAAGIIPHDDRAFGPVYMALARQGRIQKVGTAKRLRGHGTSGGNVWGLV